MKGRYCLAYAKALLSYAQLPRLVRSSCCSMEGILQSVCITVCSCFGYYSTILCECCLWLLLCFMHPCRNQVIIPCGTRCCSIT